jgi:hypothetical protein
MGCYGLAAVMQIRMLCLVANMYTVAGEILTKVEIMNTCQYQDVARVYPLTSINHYATHYCQNAKFDN